MTRLAVQLQLQKFLPWNVLADETSCNLIQLLLKILAFCSNIHSF